MRKYIIGGMSCAACSARVEKAVSSVSNIEKCSVNLLTNTLTVEGTASDEEIIKAVVEAGYSAKEEGGKAQEEPPKNETTVLKNRLIYSVTFLAVLMYFSMGYVMWGAPLPAFFSKNPMAVALVQLLLTIIVMIINKKFFISGFHAAINKAPNMDTLVAMGSGASFIYSVYILFVMSSALADGDLQGAGHLLHELYFESAAMILALITVGKMLESYSKGKTTNALKSLMNLAPKTATVIKDGQEIEVDIADVLKGDLFVVRPGSKIPVDGEILDGSCAVDESALTGESIPVDKKVGDSVSAGCINLSGFIKCRASKVGEDTTLSQIIKMVSDAASTKAPAQKAADKVSGIFVPAVLVLAAVATIVWLILGESAGYALARGISVLVISCPCALGLATPVAIMVGSGKGAKNGILFKTAQSLEECGKTDIIAFDKTGTITKGEPEVTDILPSDSIDETDFLKAAYSLEIKSEHPLAKAIVKKAEAEKIAAYNTDEFEIMPGNGLVATLQNEKLCGGNFEFISRYTTVSENMIKSAQSLAEKGKTPMFFSLGDKLLGIIAVADTIKEDSARAIAELKNMGIETVMLTGDNKKTAVAIGEQVGINRVYAGVLPDEKEKVIRELKKGGKVAMVGDGINDAPALTSADVGIAIGAGEDIAVDAAEVVLIKNRLSDVAAAIRLSRATLKNIYENLFWAFIYNTFGIPLAAGVFIPLFGWELTPMFGAAAMSLSSFCVVTNALRLNVADIRNPKKYKHKLKRKRKEKKEMKVTLKIEGMMCPHCEGRVKSTLEGIDGVEAALVSHESGSAAVTLSKDIDKQILVDAVEAQGYKVLSAE